MLIEGEKSAAAAGQDTVVIEKPVGGKVILNSITIHSQIQTSFLTAFAALLNKQKSAHRIPLGSRVAVDMLYEGVSWKPAIEWLDDWDLNLYYTAQAAGIWYYTVTYSVVVEEKPRWWMR